MDGTISLLASACSMIVALISVYNTYRAKESAVRDDGKRQQEQQQLIIEIAEAKQKIASFEERIYKSDLNYVEIKTNIDHIFKSLQRIEKKLYGQDEE